MKKSIPTADLLGASSLLFCKREDALSRGLIMRKTRYEIHTFMGFDAPPSSTAEVPAVEKSSPRDAAVESGSDGPAKALWGRMAAEVPEKTVGVVVYTAVRPVHLSLRSDATR